MSRDSTVLVHGIQVKLLSTVLIIYNDCCGFGRGVPFASGLFGRIFQTEVHPDSVATSPSQSSHQSSNTMTIETPSGPPDNIVSQKITQVPLRTGPPTREELLAYYPAKFTWDQLKTFVNSGYILFSIRTWLATLTLRCQGISGC